MAPKITVHWLDDSRSQRILWLLEELEVPYEVKRYSRTAKLLAPPELHAVHPLGKSPTITVEEEGQPLLTLAESGAITEFLIERYGGGKLGAAATGDLKLRADYLYWLHYAEGSIMFPLLLTLIFAQMPKQAPFLVRPLVSVIAGQVLSVYVNPKLKENFKFVNESLKGKEWFVGDGITGADIMMVFPVEGLNEQQLKEYPEIARWYAKVQARPAYKRAEEKGGKNDMTRFVK